MCFIPIGLISVYSFGDHLVPRTAFPDHSTCMCKLSKEFSTSALFIFWEILRCGGLAWRLYKVEQHLWALPIRCQGHALPPTHSCSQKCLQVRDVRDGALIFPAARIELGASVLPSPRLLQWTVSAVTALWCQTLEEGA